MWYISHLRCLLMPFMVLALHAWTPYSSFQRSLRSRGTCRRSHRSTISMKLLKVPELDEWKVLGNGRVTGNVNHHPEIPDGNTITTSPINDPNLAAPNRLVSTVSGSRYKLGQPLMVSIGGKNGPKVSFRELQQRAKKEKELTGQVVGDDNNQYLLSGQPMKSTSGKSRIFKAYRSDPDGLPKGKPVTVKLSNNWEALDREARNYAQITKKPLLKGKFVDLIKFYPIASELTTALKTQSALVMERGTTNLKQYVAANGALKGTELREAAAAAAQCLQGVHASGLVWTDMKTENFVVGDDGTVKGIDLESAMPHKDNPTDYSPEATPPEFAEAFLSGDGPYFVLEYNYDMWSFGMLLYEIATGRSYFDGKSPVQITKALSDLSSLDTSDVKDKILRNLIDSCLQINPTSRPNTIQVLLHPYFLATGIGPINF